MILADTGPLVALIDQDEPMHARCAETLLFLPRPMVTSWAVLTEAMHLLGNIGWRAQSGLWQMVRRGDLQLRDLDTAGAERAYSLMEQYRDMPMDLADATLIVLAEQLHLRRVFTLDAHFLAYRTHGRQQLRVLP